MNSKYPLSDIDNICQIAISAGHRIMQIYSDVEQFEVEHKSDDSPLTKADREANAIICDGLDRLDLKYPILSEENKVIPFEERSQYEYMWMVDPLDGTKEFIKRNGEFTVNIALIHKQRSIAGVVYAPALNALYYAVKGEGAFQQVNGVKKQLSCAPFKNEDTGLGIVCSRSHLNEATSAFIEQYNEPEKIAKGSSLKFLSIATNNAHIYPRLAPTMEWDTAAAQIILEEAGGAVVRYDDKLPVIYNKADLLNPHFVAYGKLID